MHAPLRVLHLNTEPTWRGGEQQLLYLLDGLALRGVTAHLVAQPGSPMTVRARERGHRTVELSMRGEADLGAVLRLRRLLLDGDYGIVHTHTSHAHTLGALAAALVRRSRRPKVVVARRVDFSIFRRSFFGLNHLKYLHGVDRYLTVSEAIRRVLIDDGVPPERIRCVHSGIDVSRVATAPPRTAALRAELGVPEGHALVGNVAHLADHKGQRYLVEAVPRILEAHPKTTFAIVGEGELKADLEERARRLGVAERVLFPGFRRDVPQLLKAFDVFVMPSHMEGLGTSVLDAMAARIPVVGTDAGGMPEMIDDGVTGLRCPIRDPEAIARAVVRLLDDPALGRRLAAAAEGLVRDRFSTDAMVEGTIAAYRDLLEVSASPTSEGRPTEGTPAGTGGDRGGVRVPRANQEGTG